MTRREQVIAVLRGEKPEVIPSYFEVPMDVTVLADLLPPRTGDGVADELAEAEFFDNACVAVALGVAHETISKDEDHHRYRCATGSVWHESYNPTFCREAISFPIDAPQDALKYEMPDPVTAGRFDGRAVREAVEKYHDAGYFVEGYIMGAWQGIYYYLARFDHILTWMAIEPDAAHALFDMTSAYSLESARRLLECGVDSIHPPCDLGTGTGLLFSPAMFREYVFPWLAALAEVCHQYGAFFHLHSHGHIQELMDGIVEAGVDIINPVGPSDRNDLALFKERWGDRVTIHGGISTTINTMSNDAIREHVHEVISIGRVGGRFFPRTESGIPPMPVESVRFYLDALREERMRGYA